MSNGPRFNPSRLTLARKRRGLTMTRLAELIRVEPRSVSAYENGEFAPDPERRALLARVLRFPESFFEGDDLEELSPDAASFRAMSKMTASKRDIALGAGAIALLLNDWIEERFELPEASLPDLSKEGGPEAAAATVRQVWSLGELPIKNMVHLLESRGVRVLSLAIDAREVDAFSMWHDSKPFIFVNTMKSAEHSRFDAAHELGHLVLHRHGEPQGQEAERDKRLKAFAQHQVNQALVRQAPPHAKVMHCLPAHRGEEITADVLDGPQSIVFQQAGNRLHLQKALLEWLLK